MADETRFVADVMLGRLGQYLKFAGYSCSYRREFPDDELIEHARKEDRILLTRDRRLIERAQKEIDVLMVKTTVLPEQLKQVKDEYGLEFKKENFFERCPDCDCQLEKVEKEKVIDEIPTQTSNWLDEYQQCPCCGKVYWKGTHYRTICERFEKWGLLDG